MNQFPLPNMSKYSSQSASICCFMSLWHVDMKTEGVNGKLFLLALTYDSSDMGAVLPGSVKLSVC